MSDLILPAKDAPDYKEKLTEKRRALMAQTRQKKRENADVKQDNHRQQVEQNKINRAKEKELFKDWLKNKGKNDDKKSIEIVNEDNEENEEEVEEVEEEEVIVKPKKVIKEKTKPKPKVKKQVIIEESESESEEEEEEVIIVKKKREPKKKEPKERIIYVAREPKPPPIRRQPRQPPIQEEYEEEPLQEKIDYSQYFKLR